MSPATPPVDTAPARGQTTASPVTKASGCTRWRVAALAAVKEEETARIVAFATVAQVGNPLIKSASSVRSLVGSLKVLQLPTVHNVPVRSVNWKPIFVWRCEFMALTLNFWGLTRRSVRRLTSTGIDLKFFVVSCALAQFGR